MASKLLYWALVVLVTAVLNGVIIGTVLGIQSLSDDGHNGLSFVLLVAAFIFFAKVFNGKMYELKEEQETKNDQ